MPLRRRFSAGLIASVAVLIVARCSSDTPVETAPAVSVDTVLITPATARLVVKDSLQLLVTLKDSSGQPFTGPPISWRTSAPTVATVTATGLVVTLTPGVPP